MIDPCSPLRPDETDGRDEAGGPGEDQPLIELADEQIHRIAKALADPQRFAILGCIAAVNEIHCKTLVAQFPITQATISHHLKELVAAELIRSRRDGQMAVLSCQRDVCDAYTKILAKRLVFPDAGRIS